MEMAAKNTNIRKNIKIDNLPKLTNELHECFRHSSIT